MQWTRNGAHNILQIRASMASIDNEQTYYYHLHNVKHPGSSDNDIKSYKKYLDKCYLKFIN